MSEHYEFSVLTPEAYAAYSEFAGRLAAIAANLHAPPPPPPTLAEAREAARQLAGPCAEVVHAFLSTLKDDPSVGRSLR
jgi:hypothetical protein